MLILRRKQRESVVLGDQVTVTVEEIRGGEHERVFGATIKLGFQSPSHIAIYRSELLAGRSGATRTGGGVTPARPGKLVEVPDAQARLRIEVPRKVPVCCNGAATVEVDSAERAGGASEARTEVYHVSCRKEDRITICRNIVIAALGFQRFFPCAGR